MLNILEKPRSRYWILPESFGIGSVPSAMDTVSNPITKTPLDIVGLAIMYFTLC